MALDVTGEGATLAIDWSALRAAAQTVAQSAYAPYSGLRVGAAGVVQAVNGDGGAAERVVVGCNVENASYGLTLCAECGLVSALHATGGGTLTAVSVVAGDGAPLVPCGRCRQLLLEHGGPGLLLDADGGPLEIGALLPSAFTGTDLAARRETSG
jgi:cytidine deaminase